MVEGFHFEHSKTVYNGLPSKVSRVSMGIKNTLVYEILYDMESIYNHTIIIKLKINKGKDIIIIASYRQWSLSDHHQFQNSRKLKFQRQRFETLLECFKKALNTGLDVFIFSDININTSPKSSHNNDYNITSLNDRYMEFKITQRVVQLNKEFTRYASNQRPALPDHILSNKPSLVKKISELGPI